MLWFAQSCHLFDDAGQSMPRNRVWRWLSNVLPVPARERKNQKGPWFNSVKKLEVMCTKSKTAIGTWRGNNSGVNDDCLRILPDTLNRHSLRRYAMRSLKSRSAIESAKFPGMGDNVVIFVASMSSLCISVDSPIPPTSAATLSEEFTNIAELLVVWAF